MKKNYHSVMLMIFSFVSVKLVYAEEGYKLWLKYNLISDYNLLIEYKNEIRGFLVNGESATITAAENELKTGLSGIAWKNNFGSCRPGQR